MKWIIEDLEIQKNRIETLLASSDIIDTNNKWYLIAKQNVIDLAKAISLLKTGNELGVSDVAAEHGALHEVGKCNASGQTSSEDDATDVDGALGEIIDTGNNDFFCYNKSRGFNHPLCEVSQCRLCKLLKKKEIVEGS